jgi:hypothetical protein
MQLNVKPPHICMPTETRVEFTLYEIVDDEKFIIEIIYMKFLTS